MEHRKRTFWPKVYTSWDDGDPLDLRVAQLLMEYNMPGIFFWPVKAVINKPGWAQSIVNHFEIGAHTVNHNILTNLDLDDATDEIIDGKTFLEQTFHKPVDWFCYPRGRYSPDIIKAVDEAGYKYARTTKVGNWDGVTNRLEIRADVHCYNRNEYDGDTWSYWLLRKWREAVEKEYTTFHIWGHSWEIEKYGDWDALEFALKVIREDIDKFEAHKFDL